MKKAITLILTLCLLLCPLGVSAAEPELQTAYGYAKLLNFGEFPEKPEYEAGMATANIPQYNSAAGATDGTSESALQEIHEYLRDNLINCAQTISIESYNISETELNIIFTETTNYYPELFHVNNRYYYSPPSNNIVSTLYPRYVNPDDRSEIYSDQATAKAAYDTALNTYNDEIEHIISGIAPEMSDLEKALYVHDYLVTHFQYDTSYDNYNAYIFFKTGVGVCQAYTQAFNGIMHRLGIECTSAVDTPDKHTWNIITLNGKNYHIDVTHDDSVGQSEGAASHTHFLLSSDRLKTIDQEINSNSKNLHSEWYPVIYKDITCTDNTYENGYAWNDADSSFEYVDGYWYYMAYNAEYADVYGNKCYSSLYRTKGFKENNLLTKIDTSYSDGRYYTNYYGGITAVGNTLYFTSPTKVYLYNTSTNNLSPLKNINAPNPDIPDISSCRYEGNGILKVFFSSKPDSFDDGGFTTVTLFKIGDTDGDGKVSSTDVATTKRYLLGSKTDFNWATVDFGNKKQVNILDLVKIKKLASTTN